MVQKGKDTPTSTRIRENQRRSRERRAELIASLQERVREYESRGVQATLEMQRAARKVAQENARLRSLLASRGVGVEEVDEYLKSFDEGDERSGSMVDIGAKIVVETPRGTACRQNGHTGQDCRNGTRATNPRLEHRQQDNSSIQPMEIHPSSVLSIHNHMPSTEIPDCPNTAECFCPPTTTAPPTNATTDLNSSSGLEISCEAAATIIAEMRGDGDRDRQAVRAALGCKGDEECRVRNSEVLGILGER